MLGTPYLQREGGATESTGASAQGEILAAHPGVDSLAREIVATGYDESGAALSPDSRWLAHVSNEQGAHEVFVRALGLVRTRQLDFMR